jgi:hypothetical protein
MVRAFEESGVDPGVWSMIWVRGVRPWRSWTFERYIELKVRGWREKEAQIAKDRINQTSKGRTRDSNLSLGADLR